MNGNRATTLSSTPGVKLRIYGQEADDVIRKIAGLCSARELEEWWEREIGWSPVPDTVLAKTRNRFDELLRRAKDTGWETQE